MKESIINVFYIQEPGTGNAKSIFSDQKNDLFIDGTESVIFLEFCFYFNCSLIVSHGI